MATVTTPSGERLEGVTGSLLEYYRGEANIVAGYQIEDDEAAVTFPRIFDPALHGDQYVEPEADAAVPPSDAAGEIVDPGAGSPQSGQHAAPFDDVPVVESVDQQPQG